jgi:hypothetical protein
MWIPEIKAMPISLNSHPTILKYLRYGAAYGLLCASFVAGIWIIESLRTNVFDISVLLRANPKVTSFLYSWGSYFFYAPFLLLIVVLENYLNTAAKTGQVLHRARLVFFIEGGIGLASVLITVVMSLFHLRPPL